MSAGGTARNTVLLVARLGRGWHSQEQAAAGISLAGRLALDDDAFEVSVRTYRRWESGDSGWPRPDYAAALRAAFGRPPEHLGFLPPPGHPAHEPSQENPVQRRQFLAAGSGAIAALAPGTASARSVDPQLVTYFYQQLDGHYAADMMLGPNELIGTVSEQYKLIAGLARSAKSPVRAGLLRVGAVYAELCAWLHQDSGEWDASAYWHGLAQTDARMVGDPDLIAYTLSNAAHLRADLRDGRGTIDLCAAALADRSKLSTRIQVNLMAQQAHGYALIGDRPSVDRLLDKASVDVGQADPAVPWGTAARRNAFYFEVQRATCYGRMGRHAEARSIWDHVNATMPPAARRDTGVYLARQATAYAGTGEPEHAVVLARESAQIAVETRSARHRQELAVLRDAMTPWSNTTFGRELADALAPLAA